MHIRPDFETFEFDDYLIIV